MTGADDERSGRGIVQLQSISSPDTDPPEPPEPSFIAPLSRTVMTSFEFLSL